VLVLLAGAAGALLVVKDRVRLVIAADEPASGPDPVSLLRDDVQVLGRDVAELRAAMGPSFERLGSALEERAATRHADVRALAAEVAALQKALDQVELDLRELARAAPVRSATEVPAPTTEPVAAVEPPQPPAGEGSPGGDEARAVPAPDAATTEAAKPEPARSGGFLSFSIPAARFRFDEQQEYRLIPELSRVGFHAKSTLHDFTGVTSKVAGSFWADFDDPAGKMQGEVVCEAAALSTGLDGRDESMREHLDTNTHPRIRFAISRFVPAEGGVDVEKMTARGDVVGNMTIRGVTKELRMPVSIEVDPSRRVVVTGQTPLKLTDWSVPVPSQLGVINVEDEVQVWIALRARVAAQEAR
jgi:polyisoprenoid-binding protein YceI